MKRKKFIKHTLSFTALIALHKTAQSFSYCENATTMSNSRKVRFTKITLYTSKIKEQLHFYSTILEFPILEKNSSQFKIKIGASILTFKEVKNNIEPFYHYAINIPSNKYQKAKKWLLERTPLLLDDNTGDDLQYFDFWDAHAMYFKDPSGNIGELIARHTLKNDRNGEFSISDLLCISEIGVPVEDPIDFAAKLKSTYGLNNYGSSMFVGDEYGLFVIPTINRPWFPENIQKAEVYPTEIQVSDKDVSPFKYENYPYKIFNSI